MKKILALFLILFIFCGILTPSALATVEPSKDNIIIFSNQYVNGAYSFVQASTPAAIVTPTAITLTSFDEPERTDAVAFALGTTNEELSKWFNENVTGFVAYDTDGNPYDFITSEWVLADIDTETAGVYYAYIEPTLGTEYILADGVTLPKQLCAVSIQIPGKPDINCCLSARGFLRFPWILNEEQENQLDEFVVWLKTDDAEWTSLSEGFNFASDGFQISQRLFSHGSTYELKISYPGGQTGVLSFQYTDNLNIIDYSGGDRDGGDVNNGSPGTGTQPAPEDPSTDDMIENSSQTTIEPDKQQDFSSKETQLSLAILIPINYFINVINSENHNYINNSDTQATKVEEKPQVIPASITKSLINLNLNTIINNKEKDTSIKAYSNIKALINNKEINNLTLSDLDANSSKNVESQSNSYIKEFYSPTLTVISNMRLRDLCNEGENVVFGSGNLTISIPSKVLLALNLSNSDTLAVNLTQDKDYQIRYSVEVSKKMIGELTGTVLRLRYIPKSENSNITIHNELGNQITDVSYDGNLLCFTADKPGIYTISEQSSTREAKETISPLIFIIGILVLLTSGFVFFRRRNHG